MHGRLRRIARFALPLRPLVRHTADGGLDVSRSRNRLPLRSVLERGLRGRRVGMDRGRFRFAMRPVVAALVISMAVLTTAVFVAPATAQGTCSSSTTPAVFPEDQLQPGMTATGLTTIQGRTPQQFDVKILGILPDAILPGHD